MSRGLLPESSTAIEFYQVKPLNQVAAMDSFYSVTTHEPGTLAAILLSYIAPQEEAGM